MATSIKQIQEQGGIDKWLKTEKGKQALEQISGQGAEALKQIEAQGFLDEKMQGLKNKLWLRLKDRALRIY